MKIKEDNVVESDKLVYSFVTYRCMNCGNVMRDEFSCNKNKCRVCGFEDWREVELQEITIVERVAQATRQDFAKEIHDKLDKLNGELGIEQKLCLFCCATSHNAMGIYHNDNCIILSLRKEFESKLGEEKNENTA